MSATFLSLLTELQLSARDTGSSNTGISVAQFKAWINRSVRRINARTEFYQKLDSITPDAAAYSFTLVGSGATNVASDFLAVRSFYRLAGKKIEGPVDISVIDELLGLGTLDAGEPTLYSLPGDGKVYFNKIPPAAPIIYCRYCAVPLDMVNDTDVPCPTVGALTTTTATLYQHDGLIIAGAKLEMADDMGFDDLRVVQERVFERRLVEFVSTVESGGKHQTLGSSIRRSRL